LQSIAAIPPIIEESIYIDTIENENTEKNPDITSYDYYVAGLKIGSEDYTVKAVIANGRNGKRYYDHKLAQIEKGKLLDEAARVTSPPRQKEVSLSDYKDKRLLSILQTNDKGNEENSSASSAPDNVAENWEKLKNAGDKSDVPLGTICW
jgi:hypothetical protein